MVPFNPYSVHFAHVYTNLKYGYLALFHCYPNFALNLKCQAHLYHYYLGNR